MMTLLKNLQQAHADQIHCEIVSILVFHREYEPTQDDYRKMCHKIAAGDRGISYEVLVEAWRATR